MAKAGPCGKKKAQMPGDLTGVPANITRNVFSALCLLSRSPSVLCASSSFSHLSDIKDTHIFLAHIDPTVQIDTDTVIVFACLRDRACVFSEQLEARL